MKKRVKPVLLLGVLFVLVVRADSLMESGRAALLVCYRALIPALFPFLVLSGMLTESGFVNMCGRFLSRVMRPLFGVCGAGAFPLAVGCISGYPVGAKVIAQLFEEGNLSRDEAERLLGFCNNAGPLFVIGAVGTGMLKNPGAGVFLYVIHLLSALLVGIVFGRFCGEKPVKVKDFTEPRPRVYAGSKSFAEIVSESLQTVLLVCGYVVLFGAAGGGVLSMVKNLLPQIVTVVLQILLEVTSGAALLTSIHLPPVLVFSGLSFGIGFGGVCVLLQVVAVVQGHNLDIRFYCIGKLLQGVFAAGLSFLLYPLFYPKFCEVFADFVIVQSTVMQEFWLFLFNGICFCFGLFLLCRRSGKKNNFKH